MKCLHCLSTLLDTGEEFEPCDVDEISLITKKNSLNSVRCVNKRMCIDRIKTLLKDFDDSAKSDSKNTTLDEIKFPSKITVIDIDYNNIIIGNNKIYSTISSDYILINEMIDSPEEEELPYDLTDKIIIEEIIEEIVSKVEETVIDSIVDANTHEITSERVYELEDEIEGQ